MRALALLATCGWPGLAEAACRLALVLALDVSGSVNAREYDLQTEGVATALGDAEVQRLLFALPDAPVALSIFEWSSSKYQMVIQDWVLLDGPEDVAAVQTRLRAWQRAPAPEATGLGAALAFADAHLERAPACWDQTLDVSADGKNNDWPGPERLRQDGALGTMNINALVVASEFLVTYDRSGNGIAEMAKYFEERIIHGPGAFVEVARGYDDYARAMTRKLIRELATLPLGQTPSQAPYRQAMTGK